VDRLSIKNLEVRCIVGVFPRERNTPQPLFVDVDLHLDTRAAAKSETLAATLDYGRAAGEIRFLLESGRFRLLETAADALVHWLLAPPTPDRHAPVVVAAGVKLTKPEALGGGALVSLAIERARTELGAIESEARAWGAVDVIYVGRDCGVYRRRLAPRASIASHTGVDEHELVLGDHVRVQRRAIPSGTAHHWSPESVRRYDNDADVEQGLLAVVRPSSMPREDRVDEPSLLALPASTSYAPPGARAS
jgi:dihydroneopterin aldolase